MATLVLAGGEREIGNFLCMAIKFVAVIQLTGIFDLRIIAYYSAPCCEARVGV
jgi:hypothetical protein